MIVYLIVVFGLCVIGITLLLSLDYSEYTIKIIKIIQLALIIIGVVQLIFKKINFKYIYGRGWGVIIIFSSLFLTGLTEMCKVNEVIYLLYDGDVKLIEEEKKRIINEGFDTDSVMTMYQFKMFEEIDNKFESKKIDNITYYYDDEHSKATVETINNSINKYCDTINELLNIDNENQSEIVIVKTLDVIENIDPGVVAFLNPITNKMYFKNDYGYRNGMVEGGLLQFEGTVIHEYTHKLTIDKLNKYSIDPDELPPWFYEGLATYVEKKYMGEEIPKKTKKEGDIKNPNNFVAPKSFSYYTKSAILINYLVETFEEKVIADIIVEIYESKDIYQSIKNVTGKTFEEIECDIY